MRAAAPILSVRALVKRFGGLLASDGIDFNLRSGEVHAIIGPNGAGKTTFVKQVTGEIRPTSGRIILDGRDVTALSVDRRILLGLGRSFQVTSVLRDMTVLENAVLAVQARLGHSFRFWRPAVADEELRRPALAALSPVGLNGKADQLASTLGYGELRQLEIAMVLASQPKVMVLDEPMAGLGTAESALVLDLLRGLAGRYAIMLVEHDMDVVFSLADRVSVLVYGRIVATGTPDEIRADPIVRASYLGEDE